MCRWKLCWRRYKRVYIHGTRKCKWNDHKIAKNNKYVELFLFSLLTRNQMNFNINEIDKMMYLSPLFPATVN